MNSHVCSEQLCKSTAGFLQQNDFVPVMDASYERKRDGDNSLMLEP
jgi:hypothetical protein